MGFQRLGHALPLHHGRNENVHALVAGGINFGKVLPQLASQEQACIGADVMLLQKMLAQLAMHADS